MKVGTDGVLLGAWACIEGRTVLDVGTGTGLIALMAAQRNPDAQVLGIEIDEAAARQAQENMAESPFHSRVSCCCGDILTFCPTQRFDVILCNPPFFTEDTLPDDKARAMARNNRSLPFPLLVPKVASLLADEGTFSVVIPSQVATDFVALCLAEGLHLMRRMSVQTTAKKQPRRSLLTFTRKHVACDKEVLILLNPDGSRSAAYEELTKEFYL